MRTRILVAVGAAGLLALAWGGASRVGRTAGDVVLRAQDPSLTERFSSMVAAADDAALREAGSRPAVLGAPSAVSRSVPPPPRPRATSAEAPPAGSLLELQRFRRTTSIGIRGPGGTEGTAVLTDLNPRINDAYLLELTFRDGEETRLHLENARPDLHRLVLDPAFPSGLVVQGSGDARPCDLWSDRVPHLMRDVARRRRPYTELCGGDVLVRHRTRGSRTSREWAADFLRSNVPGGEALTGLVKSTVYPDAFLEQAELATGAPAAPEPPDGPGFPRAALVSPERRSDRLVSRELGISARDGGATVAGRWYPATAAPGVFVSLMTAGRVAREVLATSPVRTLDAVESGALVYLVAFDLEGLDLGFGLGTDHPGVGWSERAPDSVRRPARPGPDGFADLLPLESTGFVPPQVADRVIATFAGGFKRAHGAFRSGALSRVNSASHYGFVEGGVVLSRLQQGLSTLFALDDGTVEMRTWSRSDDALLERVRSARQNGVPLLERDAQTGEVVAGALVGRWGEGNWGGSQDARLRSVRAGAGLLESKRTALPRLRVLLERHALGDGRRPRLLRLPLRHAPRHERPGAHLPRDLPDARRPARSRAPRPGHERPRQELGRDDGPPVPRGRRQPGLLLPGAPARRGAGRARPRVRDRPLPRLAGLAVSGRPRPAGRARLAAALCAALAGTGRAAGTDVERQNEAMLLRLETAHGYSPGQMAAVRRIFGRSRFAGPGNPAISRHPLSPEACRARLEGQAALYESPLFARICGGPFMAPLYDPSKETPEQARACIDQFEFPDVPCELPVVWIRADEAAEVCAALGKRLCDAHEWEGACAGALLPPDYRFDLARGRGAGAAVPRMRAAHNAARQPERSWSYGPESRTGVCGTSSHKSPGCPGGGWDRCGSNTFPAGAFPGCRSPLGVFDLHGNAAEHMNLPLDASQMSSRGSRTLGVTEMKGSWFAFDDFRAHEDWCRWRAPFWHGTRVTDPGSHANYHLGFRCCKDVPAR